MEPQLSQPQALPMTWGEVQLLLASSDDVFLAQAATLCVILPADAPEGTVLYLPVAGHGVLGENVYQTEDGLSAASQLTPAEFHADLPIVLPRGQLVLTNVAQEPAPEAEQTELDYQ